MPTPKKNRAASTKAPLKPRKKVTAKNRAHGKVKPEIRAMEKGNVPGVPLPGTKKRFVWSDKSYGTDEVKKKADRKVKMSKLRASPVVKKLQALSPKKPTRKKPPKQGSTRRSQFIHIKNIENK
jgi:hypothetical protein